MPESVGLGHFLRARRETKGLSVDDVSSVTRIPGRLVRALEEERFADLPAPVFVRGFIRAYCAEVGAPVDEALALYRSYEERVRAASPPASVGGRGPAAPTGVRAEPARRGASRAPVGPGPGGPSGRRWQRVGPLVAVAAVGGAALAGVLYLVGTSAGLRPASPPPLGALPPTARAPSAGQGIGAVGPEGAGPREPPTDGQEPSAGLRQSPGGEGEARGGRETAPAVAGSGAAEPAAPETSRPRLLVVRAHDPTWVRVQPEGGPAVQELLQPGSVREWRSGGRFLVTLGNAGGVSLELDGRPLPPLGRSGEVVRDVPIPPEPTP